MELRLKRSTQTGIIFAVAIALLFGLFSLFVIQTNVPITEMQSGMVPAVTLEKECRQVPYEQSYQYTEKQPTIQDIDLVASVKNYGTDASYSSGTQFFVEIKNEDSVGGYFKVTYKIEDKWGSKTTEQKSQFIPAGQTMKIWSMGHNLNGGNSLKSWNFEVTYPTKQTIVEKDVQKQGSKIMYKQECKVVEKIKYVPEMKEVTKTVQKSIWDSWFRY